MVWTDKKKPFNWRTKVEVHISKLFSCGCIGCDRNTDRVELISYDGYTNKKNATRPAQLDRTGQDRTGQAFSANRHSYKASTTRQTATLNTHVLIQIQNIHVWLWGSTASKAGVGSLFLFSTTQDNTSWTVSQRVVRAKVIHSTLCVYSSSPTTIMDIHNRIIQWYACLYVHTLLRRTHSSCVGLEDTIARQ